jgi:hypothetical protein
MRTAFERAGDVRSVDLLAAFAALWRDRASGVVSFSGLGRAVRFDVSEGEFVAVSSADESFDAAEVLRRADKLSAEALTEGRIPRGADRARYLRDNGLLSDRDWRWGEKLRIVEILSDLVGWLDGAYRYDALASPEASDFRIGIHRVILELYLRSSDRAFVHHSLGAPDAALERAPDFAAQFESLGLTPDALAVAASIDGKASAAEISRRVPPDPFSVEKLLAALATLGLVHPEYALEEPQKPSPPQPEPAAPRTPEPEPELPSEPEFSPVDEPEPEFEEEEEEEEEEEAPVPESATEAGLRPESVRPQPPLYEPVPAEPEDDLELLEMPSPPPAAPDDGASGVELWESALPEPLDQPLEVVAPPEFGAGRRRRVSPIWLPLVLAAGVGALLLLRSRERFPDAAPAPATASARETVSPSQGVRPLTAPAAIPATPPPPTLAPTAPTPAIPLSPRPTAPARPTPAPAPAAAGSREAWQARAERDRRLLASDPHTAFTIQLELVCELPSLDEAWVHDRAGLMWLLPAAHGGRPCFRVFWGRYRTLEEARAGKSSVPAFFFTPTNRPVVVATGPALLP